MNKSVQWLLFFMFTMLAALSSGCSGGGSSSGAGAASAIAKFVTGVAATGAPIAGGMVFIKDSSPTPIERHQQAGSDGSFSFDASDLKPPFFLKVESSTTGQNLYSVSNDYGMTNITPLTTIVVAQAAQRIDLDALYINLKPAESAAVSANMGAADKTVQNMFAPLINAFNVKGSLVYGAFNANGTGLDALLDAVVISVTPGAITVKQKNTNTLLLQATASQIATSTISTTGIQPPPTTSGSALYTAKCAGCHGAGGNSNLKGRITVALTQSAIISNRGGMGALNGLSATEIQAIFDFISAGTSTTPTPVPASDGAALYAANCAGCHGALASSGKKGITLVRLQNAISGNVGGMGSLSALSTADLQSVVTVLNPVTPNPPPAPAPDGIALYAARCAGCHGALASSSKQGVTIARLQGAIANNTGSMGSLSLLSVSEVQAIVTALTPATPTPTPTPVTDGPTLYNTNCASCHGPLATSAKAGATAARIQTAINNNTGNMGSLSTLSATQITALASALAAITPAPVTDGPTLYNTNCASCHGPLATSAKGGATAARIQAAINNNTGNMGSLSTLSSTQITALASALATITPPAPAACGSCHAIPPATGRHSKHKNEGIGCATCHGAGYSNTSFNAATHNNGVKNINTATTGWKSTSRSCSNSCHGTKSW